MTGPSLAPLIIPIAGTLFLTVAAGNPAPGHESPGR
jgi:hypothetical protein